MDFATMGEAFARPGMDTRQWISYGTVEPGEESVIFTDDDGTNPSPIGPIVIVKLVPSDVIVPCRVASSCAGVEEGEWAPFVAGDEVLVAVPEGDERAGCVIIGRLNQGIDRFPLRVAGQDVTKNTFGFKRLRTPYVIETASSFMIRSALTGAGLTIDQTGNMYLVSGDGHRFAMHASFLKLEAKGGSSFLQIDPEQDEVLVQGGGTTQLALNKSASTFFTMGTLDIGTGGAAGSGHAITTEQVIALFVNFIPFLVSLGATLPAWTAALAGAPASLDSLISAWVTACATPGVPFTGAAPASVFTTYPLTFGPAGTINTGLLAGGAIPPDPTGALIMPGIGRANLTL